MRESIRILIMRFITKNKNCKENDKIKRDQR